MINNKPEFEKKSMVEWYSIPQLVHTGIKTILSSIFGSYSDKREIQAAMNPGFEIFDYSHHKELWIDYVADIGDGFDSTFTIAKLLAQENLTIAEFNLKRGDLLIMGGDEVYPIPTREEYANRLRGPYETAFPKENGENCDAHLFAIPGNHDWYDGLTNFLKIFCQSRNIGGWKTKQKKSYFAIKLAHNVWMWGIDIQLEADIDKPQLDYFEQATTKMEAGDKVILCSALPAWIYTTRKYDHSYENLRFFEEKFIVNKNFRLIVSLAGDLHHYARYVHAGGEQKYKITSGGGGAFLHPTHNLSKKLDKLREGEFTLAKTYPSKLISRSLAFGNIGFPLLNKQFTLGMGIFYLFMTWMLQSLTRNESHSLLDSFSNIPLSIFNLHLFIKEAFDTLTYGPILFFLFALLIYGMYHFADKNSSQHKWIGILGILHGLVQIGAWYLLIWVFSRWNINMMNLDVNNWKQVLLFTVEMVLLGGIVSSLIMGLYLLISNIFIGIHDTEAFSSLKLEHFKNFLRMHITEDKVIIYPVGVEKIIKWEKIKHGSEVHFKGEFPEPALIENPVEIDLHRKPDDHLIANAKK